ncbi:PAS domain-containing sensor histidine kinase [Spirosoma rhododendri]|uniref:histidine kinase n=1 Tax=Spirosoma rhododendri TaxID=2728024 RepID=A0A7L5DQ19_9BACT|nr:PAS domain-containing sensor histidine kinase [Spirosoma rhododendri]QJD79571.1 PAS domain-containing protein [Spirosoma rhododendri]
MTDHQSSFDSSRNLHQQLDIDFVLQAAGLGVWDFDPVSGLVNWDKRSQALYGIAETNFIPYEQAIQYIHPDDMQRVNAAVEQSLDPQSDGIYDQTYRTIGVDDGVVRWVRFQGRAYFTAAGDLQRLAGVAQEVTQQVVAHRKLEESEAKLRSLIAAAPAGIGLFVGRDLVIEYPNQTFIDIVGKGPGVEGLPLREAMPELLSEGQPFLTILDEVFTTGVPFISPASLVKIVQNGVLNDNYYNISYTPIRDVTGQVYAILDIAIDVTEQVLAQQALAEKEAVLNSAVELAELGTFSVDVTTQVITTSPRVASWFGFESLAADAEAFINGVGQADRGLVRDSLANALRPGLDGRYDVVHSIVHARTGQQVIIHALGRVYTDVAGNPVRLEGTAQDITIQREQQLFLEQQVQERTDELAAANEELIASNEELAAINEELGASNEEYVSINEELEESNSLLVRSNDNLQTFAYVASHDLQEPLRKIQQFGDLLKTRLGDSIGAEELGYLERMRVAAGRMSTLIRDLLSFSRISTQRNSDDTVSLRVLINNVLDVLDMAITNTGAQVQIDELPTVPGDTSQLGQLFQNLISNALKFRRPGVEPRIQIRSQRINAVELPPSVRPIRRTAYYERIEVVDNGIGFEEKYLDRIFQVFQRLHGKSQYEGTGVGLAICEKVITNHGGAITASSQPGQGATFSVYLPV